VRTPKTPPSSQIGKGLLDIFFFAAFWLDGAISYYDEPLQASFLPKNAINISSRGAGFSPLASFSFFRRLTHPFFSKVLFPLARSWFQRKFPASSVQPTTFSFPPLMAEFLQTKSYL